MFEYTDFDLGFTTARPQIITIRNPETNEKSIYVVTTTGPASYSGGVKRRLYLYFIKIYPNLEIRKIDTGINNAFSGGITPIDLNDDNNPDYLAFGYAKKMGVRYYGGIGIMKVQPELDNPDMWTWSDGYTKVKVFYKDALPPITTRPAFLNCGGQAHNNNFPYAYIAVSTGIYLTRDQNPVFINGKTLSDIVNTTNILPPNGILFFRIEGDLSDIHLRGYNATTGAIQKIPEQDLYTFNTTIFRFEGNKVTVNKAIKPLNDYTVFINDPVVTYFRNRETNQTRGSYAVFPAYVIPLNSLDFGKSQFYRVSCAYKPSLADLIIQHATSYELSAISQTSTGESINVYQGGSQHGLTYEATGAPTSLNLNTANDFLILRENVNTTGRILLWLEF